MLTFIAQTYPATQAIGETPAERIIIYAIGALVPVLMAWIAYLHAKTGQQEKRIDRQSERVKGVEEKQYVEALETVPDKKVSP